MHKDQFENCTRAKCATKLFVDFNSSSQRKMNRLTYFNVRGRVEPLRLMLEFKKVDYEFIPIEMNEWPARKADFEDKTPLGQLPLLEVVRDGNIEFSLSQSLSIARYIAALLKLDGGQEAVCICTYFLFLFSPICESHRLACAC
jgi:hypothetical protein